MFRTLKVARRGRVATVFLNRPEVRNAMSAQLMTEMIACAGELAARKDVDVVIVTGAGPAFSAGADLKDARRWVSGDEMPLAERREIASLGYRMARAWEELPQITLCAIEGYAVGGGLALAVALDWRVLARDAFISLPEIALGIPLTWGTIPRLVNLLGPARAKRLTILCERVPARQALEMGLADYLTAPGKALATAGAVAAQVLALPQTSVRMSKETINAYAGLGAQAVSHMAHDQIQAAAASAEARAARAAFLARGKKKR
jgi:enoyl-CoA hydratase/carnithine racemase